MRQCFEMMQMFCIVMVEMVIWIYTCLKIHKTAHEFKKYILLHINLENDIKIKKRNMYVYVSGWGKQIFKLMNN